MSDENKSPDEIPLDIWVPERALQMIEMERQANTELNNAALANKILNDNLPLVAVGLTHTAKYAGDARLRFQAQCYVMDRVLGKVGTVVLSEDNPIDDLNKKLLEMVGALVSSSEAENN